MPDPRGRKSRPTSELEHGGLSTALASNYCDLEQAEEQEENKERQVGM